MIKNILAKLSMLYRNIRDQLDRKAPSMMTPWGFTLAGHEIMGRGDFEKNETKLVREIMASMDLLVNVGANVGYYCCHALSLGKNVIAVEPLPRNIFYLQRNLLENCWEKRVEIFPVALGAENNIVKIWGGQTGASLIKGWAGIPESYYSHVHQTTFDSLLLEKIRGRQVLVVVDIEGAEYMMLQGAVKSLVIKPRPLWLMEIVLRENQQDPQSLNPYFRKTFELFFDAGYQAFSVEDGLRKVTPEQLDEFIENPTTMRNYNYLFRPY